MTKNGKQITTESHEGSTALELFADTTDRKDVPGIYKNPAGKKKKEKKIFDVDEHGKRIVHGKDTYNIKEILRRNYEELDLGPAFSPLMGIPEPKFIAMLYGLSGSGKSVFAMQLAEYLARHHGKTYYDSHEERIKKTIRMRIERLKISPHLRIQIGDAVPFNRLMDKINSNHYRFLFIDSVQYMGFTFEQLEEMCHYFRKRLLSIIMISFGESWGRPDNARALLHASDIKGFFNLEGDYAIAKFVSRYTGSIVKTELFKVQEKIIKREDQILLDTESAG